MAAHSGWLRRVGTEIVHRLKQYDLMMMAAAIAFYWLLGVIPLLLLGTSAVGYLLGSSDRAVDDVMAAVSRLMPRATGPEVTRFLLVAALMGSWLLAAWPNIQDLLGIRVALP